MQRTLDRVAIQSQGLVINPCAPTTLIVTNDLCYFIPFDLGDALETNSQRVETTVGGGAGAVVRFGYYEDDGTFNRPGSLIVDLATEVATGVGQIVFNTNVQLPAGRIWAAVAAQGGGAPAPTLRMATVNHAPFAPPSASTIDRQWISQSAVSGALPASPNPLNSEALAPAILIVPA